VPTARVRDAELFYTDDGHGDPTVLLLHGLSCDSDDWVWQLGPLIERRRVVAVDLRGHGRSSAPSSGYTPPELAADLAGLIEALALGPVLAIGHSLGGVVASALAVEYPLLVEALVTIDPAYGIPPAQMDGLDAVTSGLRGPAGRDALLALIAGVEGADTPGYLRELHRRKVMRTLLPVLQQTYAGLWEQPARFGRADVARKYLRRRKCPVLAVYADPARAEWDAAGFSTEGSRALAWPGVGHWLHQERPDEFNALLLDWLSEVEHVA
jgi:pimeloyl-ACP methyl ester carboxylesterase